MRWRFVFRILIGPALLGTMACADPEPPEVGEEETTIEPEAGQDSVDLSTQPVPEPVLLREPDAFPHSEHRSIECTNCHETVPSHTTHVGIRCTYCHTIPEQFAALQVLTDQECMTCHHGPDHGYSCETCHKTADVTEVASITKPILLPGWEEARPRQMSFSHENHITQRCEDCHLAPPSADNVVDCTACHEDHHRIEATCSSCHLPADSAVHREQAHLGCSGSGCHVDTDVSAFPPSRTVCLVCHADKVDHEPQKQDCAQCHAITSWRTAQSDDGGHP